MLDLLRDIIRSRVELLVILQVGFCVRQTLLSEESLYIRLNIQYIRANLSMSCFATVECHVSSLFILTPNYVAANLIGGELARASLLTLWARRNVPVSAYIENNIITGLICVRR